MAENAFDIPQAIGDNLPVAYGLNHGIHGTHGLSANGEHRN